jgi:hypothetical protein
MMVTNILNFSRFLPRKLYKHYSIFFIGGGSMIIFFHRGVYDIFKKNEIKNEIKKIE